MFQAVTDDLQAALGVKNTTLAPEGGTENILKETFCESRKYTKCGEKKELFDTEVII